MTSTTQPVYAVAEHPIGVRTFWKRANLGSLEDAEGGLCVPLASEANVGEACAEPACWWGRVSGRGEGGTESSAAGECGTALLGTAVCLLCFFSCPEEESTACVALLAVRKEWREPAAGGALLLLAGRKEWRERDCELLCEPFCEPEPTAPREELACMLWRESRPAAGSRAVDAVDGRRVSR
jgi:hypothetical protein